jgi:hypothetical protein
MYADVQRGDYITWYKQRKYAVLVGEIEKEMCN